MRLLRLSRHARLALTLLLLGVAAGTFGARALFAHRTSDASSQGEVARIQAHFDSVLTELAAAPRPTDARASARRAALVRALRAYRDAGVFPHNYDFPGQAVPYFVDRRTGTLCAVAHLLERTGRRDIVDRVARSNNNVWVAELASDSAFTRWLDTNGLSLAEAARIQVPYQQPVTPAQVARQVTFIAVAPVAVGAATVSTLINAMGNADGHSRPARVIGFASGALAAGAGGLMMVKGTGGMRQVGAASAALGGLSIALASRATVRHGAIVAQQREAARARSVQASLSPTIGTGGAGAGIAMAIRY
jgi:hypothetical protein